MDRNKLLVYLGFLCLGLLVSFFTIATHFNAVVVGTIIFIFVFFPTLIKPDIGLVIIIISMLFSPEIPIGYVPGRPVVMRIDDILIVVIFFAWLLRMALNKELGLFKKTPLNLPIIASILVYIVSTGLALVSPSAESELYPLHPSKSGFYLIKYVEYFMLYFMAVNIIQRKRQVKAYVIAILIICALTCIYANLTVGQFGRANAPFETAGAANTLGGYLILLFAITAGLFLYNTSFKWLFWLAALSGLIFVTLLQTLSRGSFLAFIPMYLTLVVLTRRKKSLLIIILVLSILGLPFLLPAKVITRIESTFTPGQIYEPFGQRIPLDYSTAARIIGLQRVIELWKERPLLGYGVTGVGFTDMQYALVLGETGFIGVIIFIWLVVAIFRSSLNAYKVVGEQWSKGLILGFIAGFVGLLVHSFSANTFIIIRVMEPFWLLAALIMMLPQITTAEEA